MWNRIPPPIRQRVVDAALADPERSPRELAWQLTDRRGHFLSESSVADRFPRPTHRPNELWQTDFTYLPVVSLGWHDLSTVLDDYSRYILGGRCGRRCRPAT